MGIGASAHLAAGGDRRSRGGDRNRHPLRLMRYPHAVLAGTAWMALSMVPRSLSEAVQGVLRGIHRYGGYLAIELVLGGGLVAGAAVLLLVHSGGLGMAVGAEIAAAIAASHVALALALKFMAHAKVVAEILALMKRSAVFNAYSFIGSLYDRFDVVLLSKLAGDYSTGIYSVAYRALGMTQIVGYGVLYSLLPSLSRDPGNQEERARLEKAMGLLLSAAFLWCSRRLVFAGPAMRLLLGARTPNRRPP